MITRFLSLLMLVTVGLSALPSLAEPTAGSSWNDKKRAQTVTIHGLPPHTKVQLYVPSYRFRTKGKADSCGVLTVNAGKYPLRGTGDGQWQRVEILGLGGKLLFYWGDAAANDSPTHEPRCRPDGTVLGSGDGDALWDSGEWRLWVSGSTVKFYDPPLGPEMANQEYAVTLAGNDKAYSGRSLTRNLKTNACGTVKFDILNYWWDELDKGIGNIYS